jgi:hypothetical protein
MSEAEILQQSATVKLPRFTGETAWHSDWKKAFPVAYREVTFLNRALGEYHRADIHTPCGTTIEFQNSPICLAEMQSREIFYPNLVWVLNAKKFKGFRILKHLPDVDDGRLADFEFCHRAHLSVIRKSEILASAAKPKPLNFHHPELRSIPLTSHYYSFAWRFPHRVWYEAKCPIILDLGGHFLYQLKQRQQLSGNYPYLHMLPKRSFIERYT